MWIELNSRKIYTSHSEIRAFLNHLSLAVCLTDEAIVENGFAIVHPTAQPVHSATQQVFEMPPVEIDGTFSQAWRVEDLSAEVIEANLNSAKLAKNLQINEWRAQANQSTFSHLGKVIACDALSRSDIDAVAGSVALNGAFPAGFPSAWKATDNTYLMLPNVAAFKSMYDSMTAQGSVNFGRAQTLKTALKLATTIDDVVAIAW